MVEQIIGDRVSNHAGRLCAAGTVEIRHRCAALAPLERGKCGTDSLHVLYGRRGERMEMRHDIRVSRVQLFRERQAPAKLYHAAGATSGGVRQSARALVDRDPPERAAEPGLGFSEAMQ
jgi:hypothetical protein